MKELRIIPCLFLVVTLALRIAVPALASGENQPEEFNISKIEEILEKAEKEAEEPDETEGGKSFYVDGINGDDSNDGLSPESAWKTVARAQIRYYKPGDKLLYHRGQVFNGYMVWSSSGTYNEPITISAYGEGNAPRLTHNENMPVISLYGLSNFIIDGLEITAPNGIGILVHAQEKTSSYITIQNCVLHDVFNKELSVNSHSSECAIVLENDLKDGLLKYVTVKNCEIYNCDFGAHVYGISREWSKDFETPEKSYNSFITFDGLNMHDIRYDGLVLQSCRKTTVKNSRFINCAGRCSWACAPVWIHHSDEVTVEHCEIAGSKNQTDGMAIDFDGRTTNSTYQYIYSHDNNRFIRNCCYDSLTSNRNNTVQYCYSENDGGTSSLAYLLMNEAEFSPWFANSMENLTFKNNTIVNSGAFDFGGLRGSKVENNVFVIKNGGASFLSFFYAIGALFSGVDIKNNSFSGMVTPVGAKGNVPYSDSLIEGDPYSLISPQNQPANSAGSIGCFG